MRGRTCLLCADGVAAYLKKITKSMNELLDKKIRNVYYIFCRLYTVCLDSSVGRALHS